MAVIEDRLKTYQDAQGRERALTAQWDDIQLQANAINSSLVAARQETANARQHLQDAINEDATAK